MHKIDLLPELGLGKCVGDCALIEISYSTGRPKEAVHSTRADLDDKIDLWSDDVQIPSSFFKIVAWKGAEGIKAVDLVVDQKPLLSQPRKGNGGGSEAVSIVDVNHWRVGIAQIEKRSGLDFGSTV